MTNLDIIDLIETEGSLDMLILEGYIELEDIEDPELYDLIEEYIPIMTAIHEKLELSRRREYDEEVG